jgi:hypothetical protein
LIKRRLFHRAAKLLHKVSQAALLGTNAGCEKNIALKTLSSSIAAHLAGGATTLCYCWRITRRDGVVLGFTEHDEEVVYAGTTFQALTGFTASEIQ